MRRPLSAQVASAVTAALLAGAASSAYAATVLKVNKEKDKVLLELTQAELAAAEEDRDVVVEFGKLRTITHGILRRLNPVKKTVVLELEAPDERFSKRQPVRFLSAFWNQSTSPLIFNYGQYHQYPRAFVEASAGAFTSSMEIDQGEDAKVKSDTLGWRFFGGAYMALVPDRFGFGTRFDRRDIGSKSTSNTGTESGDTKADIVLNRATPGFWLAVPWDLRVHARYEYSAIEMVLDVPPKFTFNYTNGVPIIGVLMVTPDAELGIEYRDKDKFTSEATLTFAGKTVTIEDVRQVPAEVDVSYRSVSTPLFIWGAGFGFIFYERLTEDPDGGKLERKPEIPELLRARVTFEHRLSDGDKFDWMLSYDGGKSESLATTPRIINVGGFAVTYQSAFSPGFTIGGTMTGEYGTLATKEELTDQATGETIEAKDAYSGYTTSLMVFAKYDLDLGQTRGRRR